MTEYLLNLFVSIINAGGYGGVFFLMILESMIFPVPSEAVMPFAGFLWFSGTMSFWPIVFASTLGSIIGSLVSYAIGFYGGRAFILHYGKYFFLNEKHLLMTENFFSKFGNKAVFFSRFIPVVRHLISIPAGIGEMPLARFTLYTAIGAGMWNSFLAYVGYLLGSNWTEIKKYSEGIDIVIFAVIVAYCGYWLYRQYRRARFLPEQSNHTDEKH
ncbi:MAG: DedA family protein [Parcubacteria group bacterium]|nr:DedA family protein [Parcubacteria group bacterium]